ncbi:MAG: protein phosphatase 2C domain-containing protein [Xanthobacteraceae bacterium]
MQDIPADVALQIRQVGDWRLICASYRGLQHVEDGTPRQDAFAIEYANDAINLAVADGLGSANLSHLGADLACRQGVHLLARARPRARDDFAGVYDTIQGEIRQRAVGLHMGARELATTLQLLRIDGEGFWYGRLGDGGCVLVDDASVKWMGGLDRSTLGVSNLSDREALARLEWECVSPAGVKAFLIFSDGVEDIFLEEGKREPHQENVRKIVRIVRDQNIEQLINLFNKFLSSDGGKDLKDDKTIIAGVLTRAAKPPRSTLTKNDVQFIDQPSVPMSHAQNGAAAAERAAVAPERVERRSFPFVGAPYVARAAAFTTVSWRAALAASALAGVLVILWLGLQAAKQCVWLDPRPSCHQPSQPAVSDWPFAL